MTRNFNIDINYVIDISERVMLHKVNVQLFRSYKTLNENFASSAKTSIPNNENNMVTTPSYINL